MAYCSRPRRRAGLASALAVLGSMVHRDRGGANLLRYALGAGLVIGYSCLAPIVLGGCGNSVGEPLLTARLGPTCEGEDSVGIG